MIDSRKAYNRIDRKIMIEILQVMNVNKRITEQTIIVYVDSSAITVTNDEKGERFRPEGGVRLGYPVRHYLLIIVLDLVVGKMREDKQMTIINPDKEQKKVNKLQQPQQTTR